MLSDLLVYGALGSSWSPPLGALSPDGLIVTTTTVMTRCCLSRRRLLMWLLVASRCAIARARAWARYPEVVSQSDCVRVSPTDIHRRRSLAWFLFRGHLYSIQHSLLPAWVRFSFWGLSKASLGMSNGLTAADNLHGSLQVTHSVGVLFLLWAIEGSGLRGHGKGGNNGMARRERMCLAQ